MLLAAAGLPLLFRRVPKHVARLAAIGAIAVVLSGPVASRRADLRGMDRNVITALLSQGLPRVSAHSDEVDWRESRFGTDATENLSHFAKTMRGFNIVMVSLESTAAQYLSLYGSEYDVMPNLNALARRALVFENAYAVYPESIKGLFSVLCSSYPAYDTRAENYESVKCRSLAEVLAGEGYRTAMFHSGRFDYLGMQSIIQHRGYELLEDAGDIGGNHHSSFGVDEPATVDRMLSWIDAVPRGQHFFLTYLPIAGHHPYATPENGPFPAHTELDQYRNAVHYGDASLGTLIQGLRARGLEENTVFVIYGDHGEAFGQHAGNFGHTFFLYDENIHVPLVIAAPGVMRGQERVRNVVSLVDLAPTVLELMGVSIPQDYQGHSMLDGSPRMALFFADYSLGLLGLRDGHWKFEYEIGADRSRLFDLRRDPRELKDLSIAEKERVLWYGSVVRGWMGAQETLLCSWTGHEKR